MSTSSTAHTRAHSSRRWGSALVALTVAGVALQATPASAVDAPVVTGPDGTVTAGVEVTWGAVAGATQYEVQVDNDPAFGSPEWKTATASTVSVPTSPLAPGTQYVRVRAKQGSAWSDWGQGLFDVGPVAGPNLVAPADGAALKQPGEPPLLRWTSVAGATSYTVEIDEDSDFVGAKKYSVKGTSLVVPDNQAPDITYHWRVQATLATNVLSNVSDSRLYTVLPLDTPTMDTLDDVDITDVVLDWEPVPGAEYYELQVDDDYDFNSPATGSKPLKVVGTRYSPPTTYGNDQYYWRVRAVDADGNPTAWTRLPDGEHHEFDRVWRDQPQLVHPSDPVPREREGDREVQRVGDDLYFEWTPVPQASHYELWISTDQHFTTTNATTKSCQVVGTTYTPGEFEPTDPCMPPAEGTVYYWKVRALDLPYSGGVEGIFSQAQRFTYNDTTYGNSTWRIDDSQADQTVAVPTLAWEPVNNTAVYRVQMVRAETHTVVQKTDTMSTSWTPTAWVDPGAGPYYWTLSALDEGGRVSTQTTTGWTFNVGAPPVGLPTPPVPVEGQATYDAPALSWTPTAGATSYQVHVKPRAQNGYPVTPTINKRTPYTSITETGAALLAEGDYDWYVEAYNEMGVRVGVGPEAVFTVLPLGAVTGQRIALTGSALDRGDTCDKSLLDGARNWCDNAPSTPVLDWSPVPHASFYRVHVSKDADFTTGPLNSSPVSTTNTRWAPRFGYTPRALPDSQASTAYYWFIQPCKTRALCGPDPRSTVNPAKSAFRKVSPPVTLLSPAHVPDPVNPTSVVDTSEVTFTWEDYLATNRAAVYNETGEKSYQSARNYTIEVSTVPNFASFVDTATVDQPTYTSSGKLYPEGTLYWRVQALDAANNKLTWSETRTLVKRSPKPELLSPLDGDGEPVTGGTPLRWKAQAYAKSYDLQVAAEEDTNFSNPVINKNTKRTAYTTGAGVKALKPSAKPYVWRVRRTDASGLKGPWSEVGRFFVHPEAPVQAAPAAGAVVGQAALVLRWQPVAGTSRYRVAYRKAGATSTTQTTTVATAYSPTAALAGGTAYEWKVEALDADNQVLGESGWRGFTVGGTPVATTAASLSGNGRLGTRLTVVDPTWSVPGVRNSYEWQRDGAVIAGANGSWYEVTASDVGHALSVKVTGTSSEFGTATSVSASVTGQPGAGPVATTQARISGSGTVGSMLTVSPVSWNPGGVTVGYQWLRNGRAISRATGTTYTVTAQDVGTDLSVQVTGSLAGRESTTVVSNAITGAPGAAATTRSSTALRGTPTVGSTLTAPDLVWNLAGVDVAYQWLRNGVAVPGRTGRTYLLGDEDAGRLVSLRITGQLSGHRDAVLTTGAVTVSRGSTGPTAGPTSGPTSGPSAGPTSGPSAGPTSGPTKPTVGPTTKPTPGAKKVSSKTTLTVKKKVRLKGKKKVRATVTVKVRATGAKPRGTVEVYAGKKLVGKGTLKANGKVRIKLKALKRGTYKVKVTYLGKGTVKKSTSKTVKVKVVR